MQLALKHKTEYMKCKKLMDFLELGKQGPWG